MDRAGLKSRARGLSLGLFAADLGNLRQAAHDVAAMGGSILHYDIMDGVFVPQMIGGAGFVAATDTGLLRDVHLMVQDPSAHVESYINAGADMITVHAEADNAAGAIQTIQKAERPVLAGLALMPGTTLDAAAPLLALAPDLILVLSLDPRGMPANISAACTRLKELRKMAPDAVLAFDGGVTLDSIGEIAACGPDMVVSGSAILAAPDPLSAYKAMNEVLTEPN